MPLREDQILEVCEILAEEEGLKVTVTESIKGASYTFGAAIIGGLFGGPIGLAIGGTAGSVYAAYNGIGKYKSAVEVLNNMSGYNKRQLAKAVQKVLNSVDATDVITVLTLLNGNNIMKGMVIEIIRRILVKNMGLSII